jgi:AbrB family looped-hinge helix DNA binding protein
MSAMYATLTSKGQITLPVDARRKLGLQPGQKLSIRVDGDHLVIDPPRSADELRARIRKEAEAAGTWGHVATSGEGWTAHAQETHGRA